MKFTTAEALYQKAGGKRNGLPAWCYKNSELTQLEIEEVFLKNWNWIAHVSDIPESGDFQCLNIANERAVVIRDNDGQVRAFHNLCRHRGSRVVADDKGHCNNAIVCPFHGWSYQFNGELKNISRPKEFPTLDKSKYGLKPLDCEVWHGLIFVRFSGFGPSVAQILTEADQEIGLYKIADMESCGQPWHFDFDLDWKTITDIDKEGYHVAMGHPELFDLTGSSYRDEVLECGLSRSQGSFKNRRAKTPLVQDYIATLPVSNHLPESHQHLWIYWGMFPGVVISLSPDTVEVYQIYPAGFQKSVMAGACYALPDQRPEMQKARALSSEINNNTGEEDIKLVKWAAQGMESSAFDEVLLSDLEIGICAFQNQLRELIPVMALDQAPERGSLKQVNQQLLLRRKTAEIA